MAETFSYTVTDKDGNTFTRTVTKSGGKSGRKKRVISDSGGERDVIVDYGSGFRTKASRDTGEVKIDTTGTTQAKISEQERVASTVRNEDLRSTPVTQSSTQQQQVASQRSSRNYFATTTREPLPTVEDNRVIRGTTRTDLADPIKIPKQVSDKIQFPEYQPKVNKAPAVIPLTTVNIGGRSFTGINVNQIREEGREPASILTDKITVAQERERQKGNLLTNELLGGARGVSLVAESIPFGVRAVADKETRKQVINALGNPGRIFRGLSNQLGRSGERLKTGELTPSQVVGEVAGTLALDKGARVVFKGAVGRANRFLDKNLDARPFYTEELLPGNNPVKGEFEQYVLRYKGESFKRGDNVFGVRRVKPFNILKPTTYGPAINRLLNKAGIQTSGPSKVGQIQFFDTVGEDVILRKVPSEFATAAIERTALGAQPFTTVTDDSSFLRTAAKKGAPYRVILGGGKELDTLSGRAGTGGSELSQFGSPRSVNPATTLTGETIPAGTRQAYIYYAGLNPSYSDLLSGKARLSLFGNKPGVEFSNVKVEDIGTRGLIKESQEAYLNPGRTTLSPSTIFGNRAELEIVQNVGGRKQPRITDTITLPTNDRLSTFYSRIIPDTSKAAQIESLKFNIGQIEGRIESVASVGRKSPGLQPAANTIIRREQNNINRINRKIASLGGEPVSTAPTRLFNTEQVATTAQIESVVRASSTQTVGSIPTGNLLGISGSRTVSSTPPITTSSIPVFRNASPRPTRVTQISPGASSNTISRGFIPPSVISPTVSTSKSLISTSTPIFRSSAGSGKSTSSTSSSVTSSIIQPSLTTSTTSTSTSGSIFSPSISTGSGSGSPSRGRSSGSGSTSRGKPYFRPPVGIFSPRRESNNRNRFTVQTVSKGRFVTVTQAPTISTALRAGVGSVAGSARRTFRILSGRTPVSINIPGFRQSKSRPGSVVEIPKLSINTPGELLEIPGARKRRRRL